MRLRALSQINDGTRYYVAGDLLDLEDSIGTPLVESGAAELVEESEEAPAEEVTERTAVEPQTEEPAEDVEQEPDMPADVLEQELSELSRKELNARAEALGVEDADKLPNKQAVIDAILAVKE